MTLHAVTYYKKVNKNMVNIIEEVIVIRHM